MLKASKGIYRHNQAILAECSRKRTIPGHGGVSFLMICVLRQLASLFPSRPGTLLLKGPFRPSAAMWSVLPRMQGV